MCRSMYAVAANCPELEVLTLGGYNEHVTDGGITVLLEACRNLHTVKLSSKLLKVRPAQHLGCGHRGRLRGLLQSPVVAGAL